MGWKSKEQAQAYNKVYYATHREQLLKYQKDRNEKHKLYMREYRAKMYKDKEKERARCRDYHNRHKDEVNAKHRERYWKAKEEKLDRPTTPEEFREWYGYPAGTLEGWQDWDPDRCVDLATECARMLGERYRRACEDYLKTRSTLQLEAVERKMYESPMAVLVNVQEVCGAIRSEYHIYEEVDV